MNVSLKYLVEIAVNMYGRGQERSTIVSVYSHLQNSGGPVMVWGSILASSVGDLIKIDKIKSRKKKKLKKRELDYIILYDATKP